MTDSPSDPGRSSQAKGRKRRGILVRVVVASAAPVVVLWVAAFLIARSLSPVDQAGLPLQEFLTFVSLAGGLAIGLALLLAIWVNLGLQSQIEQIVRSLRAGRPGDLRGLVAGDAWGSLENLSRETHALLVRSQQGEESAEENARLRAALEDLTDKIRSWEETDRIPEWTEHEVIAELGGAVRSLGMRVERTLAEAKYVTELTLETAGDALEHLTRAGAEAEHARIEIASLQSALGEWARELEEASDGEATGLDPRGSEWKEPAPATGATPEVDLVGELERSRESGERALTFFHELEGRVLRARLELVAARVRIEREVAERESSHPLPEGSGEPPLQELIALANGAHEAAREFFEYGERLHVAAVQLEAERALWRQGAAAAAEFRAQGRPTASTMAEAFLERFVEMRAKADRLAALADRWQRQLRAAEQAASNTVQDLRGLTGRFGREPAATENDSGTARFDTDPTPSDSPIPGGAPVPTASPDASSAPGWVPGSGPLRLLTREDVLPDPEPAQEETPPPTEESRQDG